MGGCCSKKEDENTVDETTRLIDTIPEQHEIEEPNKLTNIVSTTADLLIDISTTKMLDKMLPEAMEQRSLRYQYKVANQRQRIEQIVLPKISEINFTPHSTGPPLLTLEQVAMMQEKLDNYQPEQLKVNKLVLSL